jgi:hypothetical protein
MTARMTLPWFAMLAASFVLAACGAGFFAACLFGGWLAGTWARTIVNVAGVP